ncbi:hypothetical protein [Rhizobium sp. SGZ-381]|uniref:hypothetical protein n=1 Tax=Rhizobium sp. SGZ-381 TaxID=3342800 RepID=UPI0036704E79
MAEIVCMNTWRHAHPQRGALPQRQDKTVVTTRSGAALLMFTGVRYERPAELTHRVLDETALRLDSH